MVIVCVVLIGAQHGDVARHLAQAKVLHQHPTEFAQGQLLVAAVHGRTRINHVAQAAVVVLVHRRMLDQRFDDGGHGEQVAHTVPLDQLPKHFGVQALAGHEHGGCTARDVEQGMDARAMRQGCWRNRGIVLGGAGDEVSQMVGDHKGHLPMGEHARLGAPRGARGVEEPQGCVRVHALAGMGLPQVLVHQRVPAVLAGLGRPHTDHLAQGRAAGANGRHMVFKALFVDHDHRPAGLTQVGHLGGRKPEIGGHPDTAQPKRHPGAFKERQVVARVHQQLVAGLEPELT